MGRPDASAKSESHFQIPRGECRLASAKKIRSSANKNGEAFHRNTEEQKEGKLDPLRSSLESNLYHFKAHHHPFKRTPWASESCFRDVFLGYEDLVVARVSIHKGQYHVQSGAIDELICNWHSLLVLLTSSV